MIRAFGIFPEFGDSYLWLRAADTLVCDDYMGIGYPLFLMLAKGIESISSIPYPFFVYTVQILFAFYSGVVFLRSCGMTKKVWLVWGSLGLLTCPFALQCHVAVLPNSPGFSFLLLELSVLMGILRQDADGDPVKFPLRQMFTAGVWWALGTVFVVENLWLGLVPLAVVLVLHLIRGRQLGKQRVLGELVLLAAVAGDFIHGGISVADARQLRQGGEYGECGNDAQIYLVPYAGGKRIRHLAGGIAQSVQLGGNTAVRAVCGNNADGSAEKGGRDTWCQRGTAAVP